MPPPPTDGAIAIARRAFKAILPVLILAIIAIVVVTMGTNALDLPSFIGLILNALIFGVAAFATHLYVLSAETVTGHEALHPRYRKAIQVFLMVSLLIAIVMEIAIRIPSMLLASGSRSAPAIPWDSLTVVFFVGLLVTFVFAKVATLLPAIVADGDTSLRAALARNTANAIFFRLIALTAAFAALGGILGVALTFPMFAIAKIPIYGPIVASAGFAGVIGTFSMLWLVVAAVILSKAYLGSYSGETEQ